LEVKSDFQRSNLMSDDPANFRWTYSVSTINQSSNTDENTTTVSLCL